MQEMEAMTDKFVQDGGHTAVFSFANGRKYEDQLLHASSWPSYFPPLANESTAARPPFCTNLSV